MSYRAVLLLCLNLFVLNVKSDKAGVDLKITTNQKRISCNQNEETLDQCEITVKEGQPLKINVDIKDDVNHFQCTDSLNSKVYVWNPVENKSRTLIKVPQVNNQMSGIWNCTILTERDRGAFSPKVYVNGSQYAAAHCVFRVNVRQADPLKMKLKISYLKNSIYCDQNVNNLNKYEVNTQPGRALEITVDFARYIDSFQCTDLTNPSQVFVWNPARQPSRKIIKIPQITKDMDAIWNCTILAFRNIHGLKPMIMLNGSRYAPAYCAFRVNLRQSCPPKMKLKIAYYKNTIYCNQNETNVKHNELTAKLGKSLKLNIDYAKYINKIQCVDQQNPKKVFVQNPPITASRRQITVSQVTADMDGIWNCTILTHKNIGGLAPMVTVDDSRYAASYCAFRVNVH